jgi:hypothetical protein
MLSATTRLTRASLAARLAFALATGATLASCGNASTDDTAPVDVQDFAGRYAHATCSAMGNCCEKGGFNYDPVDCEVAATSRTEDHVAQTLTSLRVQFDANAGNGCITAAVDVIRACNGDLSAAQAACNAVFVGQVPLGASCQSTLECARGSNMGAATCVPDAPGATSGHCALAPPPTPPTTVAQAGAACTTTCRTNPSDGCVDLQGLTRAAACLTADSLVCDPSSHVCVAAPAIGQACAGFCASDAYCDATGQCQPRTPDGSCAAGSDVCTDASSCDCSEPTCDPAKKMCEPRRPNLSTCNADSQCLSAYCYEGFCRLHTPVNADVCEGNY